MRNSLAGLMTVALLLGAAFSGCGHPGHGALERGDAAVKKGDPDLAIAEFTEAIRLDPSARAYHSRARACLLKKNWDRAIGDCTKAIQLDPNDAQAHLTRGIAFRAEGNPVRPSPT